MFDGLSGIVHNIIDTINSGALAMQSVIRPSLTLILTLEVAIFFIWKFLIEGGTPIGNVFKKIMQIAISMYVINTLIDNNTISGLSTIILNSLSKAGGIIGSGGGLIAQIEGNLLADIISKHNLNAGTSLNIVQHPLILLDVGVHLFVILTEAGVPEGFWESVNPLTYFDWLMNILIAAIIIVLLAMATLNIIISLFEFHLICAFAIFLVPLGIFEKTQKWGDQALAAIAGSCIKIAVITATSTIAIVSIGLMIDTVQNDALIFTDIIYLAFAIVLLTTLITRSDDIARSLLTGAPSLGISAVAGAAAGALAASRTMHRGMGKISAGSGSSVGSAVGAMSSAKTAPQKAFAVAKGIGGAIARATGMHALGRGAGALKQSFKDSYKVGKEAAKK